MKSTPGKGAARVGGKAREKIREKSRDKSREKAKANARKSARASRRDQYAQPPLRVRLSSHGQIASSTFKQLLKSPASSFATIFVIAIGLLLPALLNNLSANLDSVLANFNDSAQLSVFMDGTADESALHGVSEDLLTNPAIESISFISSSDAFAEFTQATGLSVLSDESALNALPATLVITPTDPSPEAVAELALLLQQQELVDSVQVDSQWIQRLAAASALFAVIGQIFTVIVTLGLFFIVGNTIKLAIENRRDEIRVVKLVGGTDSYAARPFLYTGLFFGLAGGGLAAVLQALVLVSVTPALTELLQLYESSFTLQGFGLMTALGLLLTGALIGWLSALISSFRHIISIGL